MNTIRSTHGSYVPQAVAMMVVFAIAAWAVLFGGKALSKIAPTPFVGPPPLPAIVSSTKLDQWRHLDTVRHDGHLWVVFITVGEGGTAPIHHPDCLCLKTAPANP